MLVLLMGETYGLRLDIYTEFHNDWLSHSEANGGGVQIQTHTYTHTDSKVIS
jgi:hypothetical protein